MRLNCLKPIVILALASAVSPAVATPICGHTPRIAHLQRLLADADGPVMIAAHRGGHVRSPENSLAAVDEAIEAGADIIEIDVHVTSDGVPYVLHDRTLDRTTDGTGLSEEVSYAQLRGLRLKGGDTPPPTLLEMLRHSCGRVLVDLDMKSDRVAPVMAVVAGLGMMDQTMLFDGSSIALRAARALEPEMPVMTRLRARDRLEAINEGLSPVRIVHGDEESLTAPVGKAIRALPARIWANSLGEPDRLIAAGSPHMCAALGKIREQGTSIIQTDYPALLRRALEKCGIVDGKGAGD